MRVKSNQFAFRKSKKCLIWLGFDATFPAYIDVESVYTGKIVRFILDEQKALACEFWDGEEMHYTPLDILPNVELLVLSRMK